VDRADLEFVQSASKTLSTITAEDQTGKDLLLELVDAGRASIRSMTEIPRNSAARFIEELDKVEKQQAADAKPAKPKKPSTPAAPKAARSRPKRAGRAKI
jgi:hypothetical protein